jgi:putative DNA primase/helicase
MTTYAKSFNEGLAQSSRHSPRSNGPTTADPEGVILRNAADITVMAIRWLWLHWLALGKLHILAGAPGQGKTTLALAAIATLTSGGRWPDGTGCAPGNALIWSGEDDPADTLAPRLIAMGADMTRVYFVEGSRINGELVPFDPARDLVPLTEAANRIGDIKLVMVDPVVSAVAGDSHKNTEVRRALQPLVELASCLDAAVLGISHFAKGGAGKDPTERVVGSVAFSAVARVVLVAAKLKNDEGPDRRVLARSKSNIGPDEGGFEYGLDQVALDAHPGVFASRVLWGKAVAGSARELLAEAETDSAEVDDDRSATDEASDALKRILKRDIVPGHAVQKQMRAEGFSPKVIRSARERIGVLIKRSGFGETMASYWKLPDSAVVPSDDEQAHSCPVLPIHAQQTERAPMGTNEKSGHEWTAEVGSASVVESIDGFTTLPQNCPAFSSREAET